MIAHRIAVALCLLTIAMILDRGLARGWIRFVEIASEVDDLDRIPFRRMLLGLLALRLVCALCWTGAAAVTVA